MNYKKIYDQLIVKAKGRKVEGYKEVHHIIPRCLGGSNKVDNLVELTAREHYVAHLLLAKIYGGKLWYAFFAMCNMDPSKEKSRYRTSSRLYAEAREEVSKQQREARIGTTQNQSTKKKISKTLSGRTLSSRTKNRMKIAQTGILHSEETKRKIRENSREKKPVLQYSLDGEFIREWDSVQKAIQEYGIGVAMCVTGRQLTTKGFKFSHKG